MKKFLFLSIIVFRLFINGYSQSQTSLELGQKAPDFTLPATDEKTYSLSSFTESKLLVVVFTCNHCPTAQAYEDRLIKFADSYSKKEVQLVAISPNSENAIRLDELGYTDIGDSFNEMKIRAIDKKFNFPYLYDGNNQEVSKAFGPVATPHAFVFDQNRILQYRGRIDNNEHIGQATIFDLEEAVSALLNNKKPKNSSTKTFGCSIKWAEKESAKTAEKESWQKEPVSLETINLKKVNELVANKNSENYLLINLWATWCRPCVQEFSSLVETHKMYRNRNFDFVSISLDDPSIKNKVESFLINKWASNKNYVFEGNKYDLIEAIDPNWQGAIPYTVLISPQGEIVYRQMGMIHVLRLRKEIVKNIGRFYP